MDSGDSRKELLILDGSSSIAKLITKSVIVESYTQTTIRKHPKQYLLELNYIEFIEESIVMRSTDPRLQSEYRKISRVHEIKVVL